LSKSNNPLSRESIFDQDFRTDLTHWISVDRKVALRVMDLVDAVMRDPFNGIGKPEPLKYSWFWYLVSSYYSRASIGLSS